MPSRQDQLHSYQFSVQRVVSALVMRDTDPAQSPFRKVAAATLAGALFAALGMAGALVYGLFAGASVDWRQNGLVLVDKETGARYVRYDGKLHPAANVASALLVAGLTGTPEVKVVSAASLRNAPRGAPIGIANAPDSMPTRKQLLTAPWTLCSTADQGARPTSTLLVGIGTGAGTPVRDALLVSTPDSRRYLLHGNTRYAVTDPIVVSAFAWTAPPVPVSPALVSAVPAGPDLRRLTIPGAGTPSSKLPGVRIGQVFKATNASGATVFGVALAEGLAELDEAEADLVAGDPALGSTGIHEVNLAQFNGYRRGGALDANLPFRTPPKVVESVRRSVCLSISDADGVDAVTVDATLPAADPAAAPTRPVPGAVLADRVAVPPGSGALVQAKAAKGAAGGSLSVVTDLGIRYPVASREVADKLGYAGAKATPMPAQVVSLLPVGPALDPKAAVKLAQR
jgi:type VII secretion protein EccB